MNHSEMDVHYIISGFPYFLTENFLDLFNGLAYIDEDNFLSRSLHEQSNPYCSSVHINSYKYESSSPTTDFCYLAETNEEHDLDSSPLLNDQETFSVADEEHTPSQNRTGISQDVTLNVGTKNRGLPQELILSLPVSKCKRWFFQRRTSRERCVICQMGYKRGEKQMILPCRHRYHDGCISRWLGINRACPICLAEVFAEER